MKHNETAKESTARAFIVLICCSFIDLSTDLGAAAGEVRNSLEIKRARPTSAETRPRREQTLSKTSPSTQAAA
jgi:hypothetical protein